jgi:hypothetical protein
VQLHLPFVGFQNGDDLQSWGVSKPATAALGAPLLEGRVGVLDEETYHVGLAGQLGIGLPLGNTSAYAGDSGVGIIPQVLASRHVGPVLVCANLGVHVRTSTATLGTEKLGSELVAALAGSMGFPRLLGLRAEVSMLADVPFTKTPSAALLLFGGRLPLPQSFEVFALVGPGLGSAPGNPDVRVMIGTAFAPSFFIAQRPTPPPAPEPAPAAAPAPDAPATPVHEESPATIERVPE